jgi:small subunit ribosomal protein S6
MVTNSSPSIIAATLAPRFAGLYIHEEKDMHPRRYETLIMLAPNLPAEEMDAFKEKVNTIMETGKGQLVSFEDWGRRRLAYPVQKELFGHYLLYDFQGSPELSSELERNLKIDEKVFKYLTLVLDKKFTDEDLVAAKENLLAEAARREADRQKAREAAEARLAEGREDDEEDGEDEADDDDASGDDE